MSPHYRQNWFFLKEVWTLVSIWFLNVRIHEGISIKWFLFSWHTGFELKALWLLGRCSTTWATPPTVFAILFFFFLQYWGLNLRPTPWATPPALFLLYFSGRVSLLPRWTSGHVLLISTTHTAVITCMHHHTWPFNEVLRGKGKIVKSLCFRNPIFLYLSPYIKPH
jgi:hypothetical protein